MEEKTDFIDTTLFSVYVNVMMGMWSINVDKLFKTSKSKRCMQVYAFISDALVILNGLSSTIRLASPGVPVAERCIGFLTTATILQSSAKCSYMVLRRGKFQRFCDTWNQSFLSAPYRDHEKRLHLIERRIIKVITICMLALFAAPGVPWCFLPFSPVVQEMHGGKFFAVPLWMPFDIFQSPANEILLSLQAINAWFIVSKMVAFDCFFFSLISLAIVELKHLRFTIEKIFDTDQSSDENNGEDVLLGDSITLAMGKREHLGFSNFLVHETMINTLPDVNINVRLFPKEARKLIGQRDVKNTELHKKRIKSRLALWIKHHQEVLHLGELIKELYYPMTMIQYVTTTLMMCFTAFTVTSVKLAAIQTIICIVFCGSVTVQLYLLCHFGDRLASESQTLADACFSSGWHNHAIKEVHTTMKIIILRAQKPLRITFLGLFPLNSETFSNVMQGAISYLMILLKVTEN